MAAFLLTAGLIGFTQVIPYRIPVAAFQPTIVIELPEMQGTSPDGLRLSVNQRYFLKNGKPWYPLMGEMHYNRVPADRWEQGILQMKAAGLTIIATYVFWNEHEAPKNTWNWSGNRDLRQFISLCAKHGLMVWLRIGPWSHGEQLYGGHPEWIARMKAKRSNDAAYLQESQGLYTQISKQTKGLFFSEGGPIVGIQLENEYASGDPQHISTLKKMAQSTGMSPVYWSVTANTIIDTTKLEVIPLQGAYPYRGWEANGGKATKDFLYGNDQWIMEDALGKLYYDLDKFPRGLCEQGAGSQMTWENRFTVEPWVVEAHLQNQVGRGMNLVGYYMFQGGTQTPGLKEPGYPENYDFQAPITESGLLRESYKSLKRIHHFIRDFEADLALSTVQASAHPVLNELNTDSLRYIIRQSDRAGFLFLGNTQVRVPMPDKQIQLSLQLEKETIDFPSFLLKGQTSPILPFNLQIDDLLIKYATAQPLAKFSSNGITYLFLHELAGVPVELSLDGATITKHTLKPTTKSSDGQLLFHLPVSSRLTLTTTGGKKVELIVLSLKDAQNAWRLSNRNREMLIITEADLYWQNNRIDLRQLDQRQFSLDVYPAASLANIYTDHKLKKQLLLSADRYVATVPKQPVPLVLKTSTETSVTIEMPSHLPKGVSDLVLKVGYQGNSCALFDGERLVTDHLYHGPDWLLNLTRWPMKGPVSLKLQEGKTNAPARFTHLTPAPQYNFSIFFPAN